MRIAITGANSSVGQALLSRVAAQDDLEAHAGVRTHEAAATLPSGPRITPHVIRYDEPDTLEALLDGVGCLVHLPGILIESKRSSYQAANVDVTQCVVDACQRAEVEHLVFVSSLGADTNSGNQYYRSKGVAEQIVAQSGLSATIIRTPILLGPGTAGARSLVAMASRPSVRVLGGGHHTLRPLDVGDLGDAILNCCRARRKGVAIHELAGPEPVTHSQLIVTTGRLMEHNVSVTTMPIWIAKLGAAMAGWVKRGGMTPTVIEVITADETVRTNADLDLGVRLTPLSETLVKLLPEDH